MKFILCFNLVEEMMLNISFGGENDGKFLVRNMMWEVVKILCIVLYSKNIDNSEI